MTAGYMVPQDTVGLTGGKDVSNRFRLETAEGQQCGQPFVCDDGSTAVAIAAIIAGALDDERESTPAEDSATSCCGR